MGEKIKNNQYLFLSIQIMLCVGMWSLSSLNRFSAYTAQMTTFSVGTIGFTIAFIVMLFGIINVSKEKYSYTFDIRDKGQVGIYLASVILIFGIYGVYFLAMYKKESIFILMNDSSTSYSVFLLAWVNLLNLLILNTSENLTNMMSVCQKKGDLSGARQCKVFLYLKEHKVIQVICFVIAYAALLSVFGALSVYK